MIDRLTVEKIKEAANIVDVVSEFVTLRKSGANYKGLCPFHNEKTPSFFVSPARGTCHCFGCGKGGNAVTFIMEHEQMTYPEALRWLARKYHIEIHERELSEEDKRGQSERESMYIVNEWAAGYFHSLLHDNVDGVALGMQYFRSRGFRDDVIEKFQLGYDLQDRQALPRAAIGKGYREEYLQKTGLCFRTGRGELLDRFSGRVIFPWTGVNGKVVGFSARVLDSRTKGVNQKYVNSPESEIYHKDHELYGIWQAKRAIAREDRVYMVEGQSDVISMYQCGIENVVANSGTALSIHQIHMLHRFTSNITLLYDGDAAGIHAALRGTDMLLSEGMNLKVLLLPDGDDPDSFARKHTAADFREYIGRHQTDFIQFKTDLLLSRETDPVKRSEAINSIVRSIAVIHDPILRDTYIHDCSRRIGIGERTLIDQMNRYIRAGREDAPRPAAAPQHPAAAAPAVARSQGSSKVEDMLMQLVVRSAGKVIFRNVEDDSGRVADLTVAEYIHYSLSADGLYFHEPLYNRILDEAVAHVHDAGFDSGQYFLHHEDVNIARIAVTLSTDRYRLPESLKPQMPADTEGQREQEQRQEEELRQQTVHLLLDYRMDYVNRRLRELQARITAASGDMAALRPAMEEYSRMQKIRNGLAKKLGSDIIVK